MVKSNEIVSRRVTLVFNTTAENSLKVASFGMNYLWFDCLNDGYPDGLVNSLMVHGPIGVSGNPDEHPEKDKIFMTLGTSDFPLLEQVIKKHIDVPFEVRDPAF